MKRIEYSRDAVKALRRMDNSTSRRIRDKLQQYAQDPASLANNVIPMKGSDGFKRIRVGDWRVVFTEDFIVLLVIRIAARGSVYD